MRTRAAILVGRQAELAAVLHRLHESVRGAGPACFCIGEPGTGKSRLLTELATRAAGGGLLVLRGRASASGSSSPLRPFAEALAGLDRRGLLPADDLGGYRPLLGRALPQLARGGRLNVGEAAPIEAFAEAVLRVLLVLGNASGCLLVLDDLHDADPESLAVLDYLLDNVAGTPIFLFGALRDQPSDARDALTTAERRGVLDLLPIRPLDREHTGLLAAACLGTPQAPRPLAELAWHGSGGNPLAVEELVYDLVAGGQLRRQEEQWLLSVDPMRAPPPGLRQRVAARVDRLGVPTRQVLVAAAVYGEQFPLAVTRAVVGMTEAEFLDSIQAAVAAQLVNPAEISGWCRFHHPLTHGAVLGVAGAAERRHSAERLAEAVLTEDPERTGTTCRVAARLLADAGQLRRAGELYAEAGRRALDTGALEFAVADLDAALRLLAPDETLISQLVLALVLTCRLDRAASLLDQLGPSVGDSDRRRRALTHLDLAWGYCMLGRTEQGQAQLANARAMAYGPGSELVRISCEITDFVDKMYQSEWMADHIADRARAAAEAAERLAGDASEPTERHAAAEAACRAWSALIWFMEGRDRYQGALWCGERMIALADQYDLPVRKLVGMRAAALEHWYAYGDAQPVCAVVEQGQRLGVVVHALSLENVLPVHQVMVGEGSLAPTVANLNRRVEDARRLGHSLVLLSACATLVMATGFRADRPAMAEALDQFGAVADSKQPTWTMIAGLGSAVCLILEGRDGEALAAMEEMAERRLISSYYKSAPLGLMLLLGTVAGTTGPAKVAAALKSASRMRWNRQFLHWAAAVHAGRRGDRTCAERHVAKARADAEIYPIARHLAARLIAPAAVAAGWGTPIEDLRAAEAWFHEQSVVPAARNCRDVLRTLGVSVPQRRQRVADIPAWLRTAGVTAREYEVALLVRERLGNVEIAERLHISPRTVEKHTAALLVKLCLPDRRALVERLLRTIGPG